MIVNIEKNINIRRKKAKQMRLLIHNVVLGHNSGFHFGFSGFYLITLQVIAVSGFNKIQTLITQKITQLLRYQNQKSVRWLRLLNIIRIK